jgi:aspartate racemase
MELVTEMTDVKTDQEHIPMTILSRPSIPDRTAYILGGSTVSPLPMMIEAGRTLAAMGAELIAIPCMTAHCFHEELVSQLPVPVVHAVRETALEMKKRGVKRAGLMATAGTVKSTIFQRELNVVGVDCVLPSRETQEIITDIIYTQVKAGRAVSLDMLCGCATALMSSGAECVILGCTELSVVKRHCPLGFDVVDAMEVLASRSVEACGVPLKLI